MIKVVKQGDKPMYYYEKGDTIVEKSTGLIYEVDYVNTETATIVTTTGLNIPLSKDIRPTALTIKHTTVKKAKENKFNKKKLNYASNIYFAKTRVDAIVPSKRDEDAGFDIYANFEHDFTVVLPHETKMIPTGVCTAFSQDYVMVLKERGSTGSKGIAQRCGIIDSGYRNEIFVPLTNTNDIPVVIAKDVDSFADGATIETDKGTYTKFIVYPYSKAICQALIVPVPPTKIVELPLEKLQAIPSERGLGALGSSGK